MKIYREFTKRGSFSPKDIVTTGSIHVRHNTIAEVEQVELVVSNMTSEETYIVKIPAAVAVNVAKEILRQYDGGYVPKVKSLGCTHL